VFSTNKEYEKAVIRVDIFKHHTQFIQFMFPNDADKIGHTDLVVIDEAAAIPLPYVKTFFGPHNLFMASTINGYEGTGRSLSLKLIEEIRQKNARGGSELNSYKKFKEVSMTDPIRYALNDEIERWLNELLLLNATDPVPLKGERLPHPSECDLYIVNRDTLFCYKSSSEKFLFNLMSLFISSHYKNSPNDLQLLSDSPSHLIFVLLGPIQKNAEGKIELPDIFCAIQVAL
jgi:N-acetyltransferase 10